MRFPEEKIKEAILHPDRDVRDAAMRYFYDSTNLDQTLMPLAIQAIEKYGRTEAFSDNHYLNGLPQTSETVGWVINELYQDFEGEPERKHFYYLNWARLLGRANIQLVAPNIFKIIDTPHIERKEKAAIQERLQMFGWDATKCWEVLYEYCEAYKDKNKVAELDLGPPDRLIEALARDPQTYQSQILAILTEQVYDFRHDRRKWLQPFMAKLAGHIQLQAAIPFLVNNLGHPNHFLADQSLLALPKIGGEEVIALACSLYPRGSRDYRSFASELLGMIHLDVAEQRALELLASETDLEIRLNLCEGLLGQLSSEGVEPARRLIKQHHSTLDLRYFQCNLISTCKIMGIRFPEFDVWHEAAKNHAHNERKAMHKLQKMVYDVGDNPALFIEKLKMEIAQEQSPPSRSPPPPSRSPQVLRPAGGRDKSAREKTKVGRNDPCACGSGKKFKMCCLKK